MGSCPTCLSGISPFCEAPPGVFCSPWEGGRIVCLKTSSQPPGLERFPSPNMLEMLMACDRGENAGSMPIVSSGYWPMLVQVQQEENTKARLDVQEIYWEAEQEMRGRTFRARCRSGTHGGGEGRKEDAQSESQTTQHALFPLPPRLWNLPRLTVLPPSFWGYLLSKTPQLLQQMLFFSGSDSPRSRQGQTCWIPSENTVGAQFPSWNSDWRCRNIECQWKWSSLL